MSKAVVVPDIVNSCKLALFFVKTKAPKDLDKKARVAH
jgi:hypothetical protein